MTWMARECASATCPGLPPPSPRFRKPARAHLLALELDPLGAGRGGEEMRENTPSSWTGGLRISVLFESLFCGLGRFSERRNPGQCP